MPKQEPFKMSEETKQKFTAALDGLTSVQKSQILNAVSFLCAEVEMHSRVKVFEQLRQEWAESLGTMLRFMN